MQDLISDYCVAVVLYIGADEGEDKVQLRQRIEAIQGRYNDLKSVQDMLAQQDDYRFIRDPLPFFAAIQEMCGKSIIDVRL